MQGRRVDRRVRRTRQLLRDALTALVVEKGYERVTVQDICDRADVGRSTFYAHFQDKEELLLSVIDEVRPVLHRAFADHELRTAHHSPGAWAALTVIRYVAEFRRVSALLGSHGSTVAAARLRTILSELIREHLHAQVDPPTNPLVPMEVAVAVAVSALLGMIDWWLDHDRPYSPEQLGEMYRLLIEPGMLAAATPASAPSAKRPTFRG